MSLLSLAGLGLGTLENHLVADIPRRQFGNDTIGYTTADITVREHHIDRMAITQHPVEQKANISDHAYKLPAEVTLYLGWSNSGLKGQFGDLSSFGFASISSVSSIVSGLKGLVNGNYVTQIYGQLVTLQVNATPIKIITGKRNYSNMLIESLEITTDETTEYALLATMHCKEVIIVSTVISTINTSNAVQSNPRTTGTVVNNGTQAATPSGMTFSQLQTLTGAPDS